MDQPKYYEQWGAPVLLYRHRPSYSQQNENDWQFPNAALVKTFLRDEARLHRAMARWYLQQEFPLCLLDDQREDHNSALMKVFRCFEGAGGMKLFGVPMNASLDRTEDVSVQSEDDDDEASDVDNSDSSSMNSTKRRSKVRIGLAKRRASVHRKIMNPDFVEANVDREMQLNHAEMLLTGQLQNDDEEVLAKRRLLVMSQLDANFIPTMKIERGLKMDGFSRSQRKQNCMYTTERSNRGDPAYLAPFPGELMRDLAKTEALPGTGRIHTKLHTLRGPNPPKAFGNCLLSFPCQCGYCSQHAETPTPCILHPVGPMLDCLRISYCWLESNQENIDYCHYPLRRQLVRDQCFMYDPNKQIDFDVGEKVLEIQRCGADEPVFVIRTACYLTMIRVDFMCKHPKNRDSKCWSGAYIALLQRWDHRTLSRSALSFKPATVAAHPNFGKHSPANIVAVYKASNGRQNYIHHIHATGAGEKVEQHVVRNLQEITHLEFSRTHPMVLWSAARSFVHPIPWTPESKKRPRLGYGTALYSVDLRCCEKAKFQWSPSMEEYYPECIHSISGLITDCSSDHRLWISSISAARTWEIDSRMPCRTVTSYSLPHYADQQPSIQAIQEVSGAGALFSQPWNASPSQTDEDMNAPVLCVGKSPRTFGIQLYHRLKTGHYHAVATECFDGPLSSCMHDLNIARSTIFPLPDRSDCTFPIGLTSFKLDLGCMMDENELEEELECSPEHLTDMLCAISLTSKGDMYLHSLLGTKSPERLGKHHQGLPGGCSVVTVPETFIRPPNQKLRVSWNALVFGSTNDMPVPGDAVDLLTAYERRNTIDLKMESKAKRNEDEKDPYAYDYSYDEHSTAQYLTTNQSKCKVKNSTTLGDSAPGEPPALGLRALSPELFVAADILDERPSQMEELGIDTGDLERSDLNADLLTRAWPKDTPAWNVNGEEDNQSGSDETESDEDDSAGNIDEESADDDGGDDEASVMYEDI